MTEKLYYQDSHRKEFEAQVVSCQWNEKKEWYEVILDRTVFFPEGGGQYADPGVIDGIPVEDVKEREGEVIHMMKKPLTPGPNSTWRNRLQRKIFQNAAALRRAYCIWSGAPVFWI